MTRKCRLDAIRHCYGMTMRDVADFTGLSFNDINAMCCRGVRLSWKAKIVAQTLKVPYEYFMGADDPEAEAFVLKEAERYHRMELTNYDK